MDVATGRSRDKDDESEVTQNNQVETEHENANENANETEREHVHETHSGRRINGTSTQESQLSTTIETSSSQHTLSGVAEEDSNKGESGSVVPNSSSDLNSNSTASAETLPLLQEEHQRQQQPDPLKAKEESTRAEKKKVRNGSTSEGAGPKKQLQTSIQQIRLRHRRHSTGSPMPSIRPVTGAPTDNFEAFVSYVLS